MGNGDSSHVKMPGLLKKNSKLSVGYEFLVGGFNPFEKYLSKWESSPKRGEHKNIFETTTQIYFMDHCMQLQVQKLQNFIQRVVSKRISSPRVQS